MFNSGDFKRYLEGGDGKPEDPGLPRLPRVSCAQDEDTLPLAKTFLRKTLAQHDAAYHKHGYHEGDKCNFREALMRGDSADAIKSEERKEASPRYGLVKFVLEDDGGKKVLGIEDVSEAVATTEGKTKDKDGSK